MEDLNQFVPNVHFEKIPIKNLVSNQKYQRNLSQSHIARAAANFDLYQINPVKVSRRDGVNYVFNGQHTIEIVALVSGSRDTPVWCMIYEELVYEHEADIFANQQKFVKPLSPYEVFLANLEAGNDDQLIIRDLVESYGLEIGTKKAPCVICAVSTLEQIYQKYGYHTLSRVLRLCIGTWEGDMNSFSANILNGITKLISVFGDQLNDEIFKEKVGAVSVKQLVRTANALAHLSGRDIIALIQGCSRFKLCDHLVENPFFSESELVYHGDESVIDPFFTVVSRRAGMGVGAVSGTYPFDCSVPNLPAKDRAAFGTPNAAR